MTSAAPVAAPDSGWVSCPARSARITSHGQIALFAAAALFSTALAVAQEVFSSGDRAPLGDVFNSGDAPAEDLRKYLSPDGRFIDRCRYWQDHPDRDTRTYGSPDHFAPGQPLGETRSFNGQPAPYVRCALDPCPPHGAICWRNPSAGQKRAPLQGQVEQWLKERDCESDPNGDIYCEEDTIPSPSTYQPRHTGVLKRTRCRLTDRASIACDTGGPGGGTPLESGTRDAPRLPAERSPAGPPRSQPPLQAGVDRICDMRKLAAYVNGGYYDSKPVARLRVTNAANPSTYLILLSGMQPRLGSSTNLSDALVALFNIQGMDSYRMAIMDALQGIPKGSTLILAGHSQGGMEAQNAVANLTERWGFKVSQVITYGSPVSESKQAGTAYLHLRERRDPVPAMDRGYDLTAVRLFDAGPAVSTNPFDPTGAHLIYDKVESGLQHMAVPAIPGLRTPCLEVDVTALVRKPAPDYFTRMFTRPANYAFKTVTPRNPDVGFVNCFWVSLAQDRYWREGLPYYAMCEAAPIDAEHMRIVLVDQFGGRHLDSGLGPDSKAAIARQDSGVITHTTRKELERALLRVGTRPDGRLTSTGGLVFVKAPGTSVGHVFNVRLKLNGTIEYVDAQAPVNPLDHFLPGADVAYYRTF